MNANRRKRLRDALKNLDDAKNEIESVRDEEDEARDNIPESLQDTDRYIDSEEASEAMDMALDNIEEAVFVVEGII